jgi:hypothetical protein
MARKLKVWNGRFIARPRDGKDEELFNAHREVHANVCAYSRADVVRVIEEYLGYKPYGGDNEIKVYWSDCWGNSMKGIEPERGMWLEFGYMNQNSILKRVV